MIWLTYKKNQVRKEVKRRIIEGIDQEELVHLVFTDSQLNSVLSWKHSEEFEFKGEMYDVVTHVKIDSMHHYWCWWDNDETELSRRLDELVTANFGTKHQDQGQIQVLYQLFNLYHRPVHILSYCLPPNSLQTFLQDQSADSRFKSAPLLPPPELG